MIKTIEQNNADFGRRVRAFHRSEDGQAIRQQLIDIQKQLFNTYKQIALDHWQANGNSASTGWGCVPEEQYSTIKRKPVDCAHELANKLTKYMMENPDYALGYK